MFVCKFDQARDSIIVDFVNHNLLGKKILELGCSTGDRTRLFYSTCQVIAVDIVDKVNSERKRKFAFFLADATALPFENESFDAVVSFDVIEHVLADEQFVNEAFRVCKKGGFVILGTPNRLRLSNRLLRLIGKPVSYPYYLGPGTIHLREYTWEQFDSICRNSGLVGNCLSIWIGLVGKIDRGLAKFPSSTASLAQYLLFIGYKP